jgi:hypothetical protein
MPRAHLWQRVLGLAVLLSAVVLSWIAVVFGFDSAVGDFSDLCFRGCFIEFGRYFALVESA